MNTTITLFVLSALFLKSDIMAQTFDIVSESDKNVTLCYKILYKGFHCIKSKSPKGGNEIKIYLMAIPETESSCEMADILLDSITYEGVKTQTIQPAPVRIVFRSQYTECVSIFCYITENSNKRANQRRGSLRNYSSIFKNVTVSVSREKDITQESTTAPETSGESRAIPDKNSKTILNENSVIAFSANPTEIAQTLFQPKTKIKSVEQKYFLLKTNQLIEYLNESPKTELGIEYHFIIRLQKEGTIYDVFFEVVPMTRKF
jgi:hypothetical protein